MKNNARFFVFTLLTTLLLASPSSTRAANEPETNREEHTTVFEEKQIAQRMKSLKFNQLWVDRAQQLSPEKLFYLDQIMGNLEALPHPIENKETIEQVAHLRDQAKKILSQQRMINFDDIAALSIGISSGIGFSPINTTGYRVAIGILAYLASLGLLRGKAALPYRAFIKQDEGHDPAEHQPRLNNPKHGVIRRSAGGMIRFATRVAAIAAPFIAARVYGEQGGDEYEICQ